MRERRHVAHLVLAGMVAGAAVLLGGKATGATTTGSGSLEGHVTFGSGFPCSTCSGGALSATAAMTLTGVPGSGVSYTAIWPDPTTTRVGTLPSNFTATFGYTASCLVSDALPPVLGNAGGPFTLDGGMLVLNAGIWDNATLSGTFTWQQIGGDTVALIFRGLSLTGGVGPSQVAVNLNNAVIGVGIATFPTVRGTCLNPQPDPTALIVGTIVQPA